VPQPELFIDRGGVKGEILGICYEHEFDARGSLLSGLSENLLHFEIC
jgi:hypothetical protein